CRAEAYLVQNRATEALPLLQAALKTDANLYEAKVAEGRALALSGKPSDAEVSYRAAIAAADTRADAHRWLGALLIAQGRKDLGVAELKKAQGADPNDPDVAFEIGTALGSGQDAGAQFAKAAAIRPSYAAAHAELARLSFAQGDMAAAE